MHRRVFDAKEWSKTGDIGDNSQFWKKAEIIRQYNIDGDDLCDVMFEDGRISNGHFYNRTEALEG